MRTEKGGKTVRLIDADALRDKFEKTAPDGTIAYFLLKLFLNRLEEDAPTVDAVPVVRCKD